MSDTKNGSKSQFARMVKQEIEQRETYQQKLAAMKAWLEKRLGLRNAH